MEIFRRHLIAISTALLALAGTGVATASDGSPRGSLPHNRALTRTYLACPARDRRVIRSPTAGSSTELVPAGVRQVLLCRYSAAGLAPESVLPGRLIVHRLVAKLATVKSLASGLDALKTLPGSYSCPADNGTAIIAFFRYRTKSDDPVTIGLSGCLSVTNGHLNRLAGITAPGRNLLRQLEALTQPTSASSKGILTGKIRWVGGDPLSDRPMFTAGVVRIFGLDHKAVTSARVRTGHRFRFELLPGQYQLSVDNNHGCPLETARIRAGHTTRINVPTGCGEY